MLSQNRQESDRIDPHRNRLQKHHRGMVASSSPLLSEIEEQPRVLQRLLDENTGLVAEVAAKVRDFDPQWVVIAARGTSDNAARYAQYLLGAHNQLSTALAVPSLHTLYKAPPRMKAALTIGISQSGQSPDVVSVLAEAKRQGGLTIAITNDPGSPLASQADACIPLRAGEERSVAATKTYTSSLMTVAMLSAALDGQQGRAEALAALPAMQQAALTASQPVEAATALFHGAERCVVIGRGFNYCSAFEIALKLKETSYLVAEPYSIADFLHGPMAMIDEGFPVIVVAPRGIAAEDAFEWIQKFHERGARVLAITDREDVKSAADVAFSLPRDVPEWLSPIVAVAPAQRFAHALAASKGYDADRPRGLRKVTLTR
jgi:glucosamine--fructose-6-phosphate aminotransferase (isomerizing)